MAPVEKLLQRILRGDSDANIPFSGLRRVLRKLGFEERVRGSHHIYHRRGVEEIINLQPRGDKCKPYQVKQIRQIIVKYKLGSVLDVEPEV